MNELKKPFCFSGQHYKDGQKKSILYQANESGLDHLLS